jgi:hypothetical protein
VDDEYDNHASAKGSAGVGTNRPEYKTLNIFME